VGGREEVGWGRDWSIETIILGRQATAGCKIVEKNLANCMSVVCCGWGGGGVRGWGGELKWFIFRYLNQPLRKHCKHT
jgi:hypothetical protein